MGGWFSSQPEVQAKEAITQTGNAAVQFNWAIFSTGISSLAIILVLLVLLAICYRKNQRSNRRARRSELHDIVHSLHRSTPGTEPARMGYPQYPPSVANYVPPPANVIPMVAYPSAPPITSAAPRAVTYAAAPGIQADTPGMPGVNSGRQANLRIAKTTAVAPRAQAPIPLPSSPLFPTAAHRFPLPRLTSIREAPPASIARPRPTRATAAPRAIGYDQRESRKSLYDLFPGNFPSNNAFPSLAFLPTGKSFATERFTEL